MVKKQATLTQCHMKRNKKGQFVGKKKSPGKKATTKKVVHVREHTRKAPKRK